MVNIESVVIDRDENCNLIYAVGVFDAIGLLYSFYPVPEEDLQIVLSIAEQTKDEVLSRMHEIAVDIQAFISDITPTGPITWVNGEV